MKYIAVIAITLIFINISGMAVAQESKVSDQSGAKAVRIHDLSWMDRSQMEKELKRLNELAQSELGTQIHQDLSDLDLLQRLIDKNIVKNDDTSTQQSMGFILGNVMLADFPHTLEWKIYEDKLGRSRALCVKGSQECLFPVTMLQRRMRVGIKPDVKAIYKDAIGSMENHLPKAPYGGGVIHRLR